jgi:hypothetical protein
MPSPCADKFIVCVSRCVLHVEFVSNMFSLLRTNEKKREQCEIVEDDRRKRERISHGHEERNEPCGNVLSNQSDLLGTSMILFS